MGCHSVTGSDGQPTPCTVGAYNRGVASIMHVVGPGATMLVKWLHARDVCIACVEDAAGAADAAKRPELRTLHDGRLNE